jgi:hypothetical protein
MVNETLNWDAISTISTTILTAALIGITWWYAAQIEKRAKADRLNKEMDLLVSPLYSKSQGDLTSIYFMRGAPGYFDSTRPREQLYFKFWDDIRRYKYLGPEYLQSALDTYFKNKVNDISRLPPDNAYQSAETELFDRIKQRYSELQKELAQ